MKISEEIRTGQFVRSNLMKWHMCYIVFRKSQKHGIETPPRDLDLIKQRLKRAEEDYDKNYQANKRGESR